MNNKKVKCITIILIILGLISNLLHLWRMGKNIINCTLFGSVVAILAPILAVSCVKQCKEVSKTPFLKNLHLLQVVNTILWLHVTLRLSIFFLADNTEENLWFIKSFIVITTILTIIGFSLWSEADIELNNETTYIETTMPLVEAMYMLALYMMMWKAGDGNRISELTVVFLVAFAIATTISTNLWPKLFPRPHNNQVTPNATPETTESKEVLPTTVPPTNEPPKPEPIHDSTNLIQKELHTLKTMVAVFIVISLIAMALLVGTVIGAPTLVRAWSDQMEAVPVNSTAVVVEQETSKYNPNSGAMYTADNT